MKSSTSKNRAPADAAKLREFIESRLADLPARTETVVVSVPVPSAEPCAILGAFPSEDAFLWRPPAGPDFGGAGTAFSIEARGESRLDRLREESDELWKTLVHYIHDDCEPSPPALFGGLSFEQETEGNGPWESYSDGSFAIPRWCYGENESSSWLSLALRGEGEIASPGPFLDRLPGVLERLGTPLGRPGPHPVGASIEQMEKEQWISMVESIREGIGEGRFSKVVAARRAVAELTGDVDPVDVIRRLETSYPDCYRFLFRRGGDSFLGATPERLVRKEGSVIATEALAGSIDTALDEDKQKLRIIELLDSRKDLGEHELVVDAIRRMLAPFCSRLEIPARPTVRELRNVVHLHTPMRGKLARDSHILDLVASLHPTPSVGGVPTADALRWITKNEPDRRGWYAGPVGWFDGEGNGDLAVAIRSGVLRGRRAYIFAGAGIVHDSDPIKEYDETRTKQKPILRALGIRD